MSRTRNHSCSCWMCQPHKHGLEEQLRPSERRRLHPDHNYATDAEFEEVLRQVMSEHALELQILKDRGD